jgi:hypothetical protein
MNKLKFLSIVVFLLVLTNIGVLLFFMLNKPEHPSKFKRDNPKEIIIERLELSKDQIVEFEASIAVHRFEIEALEIKIRDLKHNLYECLTKNESNKAELFNELASAQRKIEETHYKHFEDIRSICKGHQIAKFNELSKDLARVFAPTPHKHHLSKPEHL